jgi:cephalosporin hydroxylase
MDKTVKYLICFLVALIPLNGGPVEDIKKSVCDAMQGMYGWCSKEKAVQFIDLVLEVKPEVCVEIGVFGGQSLFPVASALKYLDHGVVVGIDPWSLNEIIPYFDPVKEKAHVDWWSRVNMEQIYYSYLNMLSQHQLEDYVITIRNASSQAIHAISQIDILYIDGNHSEAASCQDVKLFLPKVRSGGYIWLNDSLWSDLQSAVDLLFEDCEFIKLIDGGNCILFRKK